MTSITPTLLDDTLKLMQLARETARARGQASQAERLSPVVDNLSALVNAKETKAAPNKVARQNPAFPPPTSELMAQNDFKSLLAVVQEKQKDPAYTPSPIMFSNPNDRNHVVTAMAAGGMSGLDIARQMGMTRDEVQMVLSLNQPRPMVKK